MCVSPISIPNPNYGNLVDRSGKKRVAGDPMLLKDCTSKMISVPCGHCDECIAVKQMYLIQRVQLESVSNHVFFCTCTYNNDMIPTLTTSQGVTIRYTDFRDFQLMFKRLRNDNAFGRDFRYFLVTERGSKKARPHAHILFFVPKEKGDNFMTITNLETIMFNQVLKYWCRNVGSKRAPMYVPCCTYIRKFIRGKLKTTFDLHYVQPRPGDPSNLNVAWYCLKYMLKSSRHDVRLQQALRLNYDDDEYRDTWKLVRSRSIMSKGFGLGALLEGRSGLGDPDPEVLKYLRECVKISKNQSEYEYPLFFNPATGQSFPLSPYFKKRGDIFDMSDALSFYFRSRSSSLDSPIVSDEKSTDHEDGLLKYIHSSKFHHDIADELCDADLFDELFN